MGCIQKITGLFILLIGIILLIVLIVDMVPFDELLALIPIVIGVKLAFPDVRLPKLKG